MVFILSLIYTYYSQRGYVDKGDVWIGGDNYNCLILSSAFS